MPKIADIRTHIQDSTGCSRREATKAANRCFADAQWAEQVLGIEKYHQLFSDPTGETATTNALKEAAA